MREQQPNGERRKVFYINIFIEFIAEGKFMIPPCGAHGVDKF